MPINNACKKTTNN